MSAILRLSLLTVTIICGATVAASSINQDAGGGGSGTAGFAIESGFRTVYNNYKQCEGDPNMLSCLKLKALKLVDRALAINNIPISEGISLAKREDHQRSLDEHWSTTNNAIDETAATAAVLPQETKEPNEKLDELLWKRVKQFVESRSLQLRVNKLLFGDDYDYDYDDKDNDNANLTHDASTTGTTTTTTAAAARGKKDKNKGMYMYMMMMKGGMMALAYKGLALLAGKALLVSKIALTLALLVAIKKLFSGGHHSQKTTYEIVKTPIITHSHQYSGGNAAQNAHYANDFTGYEGGPYARSLDEAHSMASQHQHQHQYHYQQQQQPQSPHRITLKAVDANANANADVAADATNVGADSDSDTDIDSRYTTSRIGATAAAAAAAAAAANSAQARSLSHSDDSFAISAQQARRFNVPYAHLAAYSRQLALARSSPRPYTNDNDDASSTITTATATATATTVKSVATAAIN